MNAVFLIIFRVMIVLSIALLVIGIAKPEWLRFGQRRPGRTSIIGVAIGLLIGGVAGAGAIQDAGKNSVEIVNRGKMLGEAVYALNDSTLRCESGAKPGDAGVSNEEKTSAGIR